MKTTSQNQSSQDKRGREKVWESEEKILNGSLNVSSWILSSLKIPHEDHAALEEIYGYIHSLNIHPSFRMADGAEALEKIFLEIVKIVRTHSGWCVGVTENISKTIY